MHRSRLVCFPKPFHSCCQQNSTEPAFNAATEGWTTEDKKNFIEWSYIQGKAEQEERIRQEQAQPAMTMPQYINALKNVNFSDEYSVGEFLLFTQHLDWRPDPQPIVLGTENCHQYQLISCLSEWEVSSDIAKDAKESEAAEIRSTLVNTKSPVQYIVTLGYLQCVATHTYRTRPNWSPKPINTPFIIVLNIVDKSLWMVLGKHRRDTGFTEEDVPIPANANGWDFLPEPANGRPSFDVMQICRWKDFIALDQTSAKTRRFFSKEALATAVRVVPELWAVAELDVKKALENK
jgi:hypothetical protein